MWHRPRDSSTRGETGVLAAAGLVPGRVSLEHNHVYRILTAGGECLAEAAGRLARKLGSEVAGWSFLLEISFLNGRGRLTGAPSQVLAGV